MKKKIHSEAILLPAELSGAEIALNAAMKIKKTLRLSMDSFPGDSKIVLTGICATNKQIKLIVNGVSKRATTFGYTLEENINVITSDIKYYTSDWSGQSSIGYALMEEADDLVPTVLAYDAMMLTEIETRRYRVIKNLKSVQDALIAVFKLQINWDRA